MLGQSQPRVSHHVRVLDEAGLVERRKEGSFVYLKLADGAEAQALFDLAARWLDDDSAAQLRADASRLDAIREARAEAARKYFEQHARTWEDIRSLHVEESAVERAIEAALAD